MVNPESVVRQTWSRIEITSGRLETEVAVLIRLAVDALLIRPLGIRTKRPDHQGPLGWLSIRRENLSGNDPGEWHIPLRFRSVVPGSDPRRYTDHEEGE